VAAGLTPLATGTDTACSVRIPAALCGVVGLKTTVGRVSRAGAYPLSATLDSVGPIGRSVRDVALLFEALQGPDPDDPTTLGIAPLDALSTLDDGVRGLRLGFAEGLLFTDVDAEVEHAVRACGAVFGDLGALVGNVEFAAAAAVMARPSVISQVEGYVVNAALLEARPDELDPVVRERMLPGGAVRAVDYRRALEELVPLRRQADRLFDRFDVLLAPTSMLPAVPVADVDRDFPTYMQYASRYLRNCFVGNLLNLCAVTIPCGFTAKGLPIGLMIYARAFREDLALRAAQAFESVTGWQERQPDLRWITQTAQVPATDRS
jgi:aspartyl-tRNA(Asn)/glutamyl-tRNA(Gln) amidotransferase subunit A